MPRYKEIRKEQGIQAKQVANTTGIDPTIYSRFENYRVLPIPEDFEKIVEALKCLPSEVYTPEEVLLLPNVAEVEAVGGARTNREPSDYKMTVRLDNKHRSILTKEVLQKCGYKSINDWVIACVERLKRQYESIKRSEQKRLLPKLHSGKSLKLRGYHKPFNKLYHINKRKSREI